ncbi:MAG: hypothetical protein AB8H80_15545 [Planctomycetota bacterium]
MLRSIGAVLIAATAFPHPLSAQQLSPGYRSTTRWLPSTLSSAGNTAVRLLRSGAIAWFDGFALRTSSDPTAPPLLSFSPLRFGSFTLELGSGELLFGESSNGTIWRVPVDGTPPVQLATLNFNYDAEIYRPGLVLVSARTGGFSSPDNELHALDTQTGQTSLLAVFPGASGPLTVDPARGGDVLYANAPNAYPAPSGSVAVFRLTRATVDNALQTQTVLGPGDAQLVLGGLDAVGDMAVDQDGDLHFVDWQQGRIGQIESATVAGAQAQLGPPLLDYGAIPGSVQPGATLQFVAAAAQPDTTRSAFEPFQPATGTLVVHETDYGATERLRSVFSSRMRLAGPSQPVPTGAFDMIISRGPSNGAAIVLVAQAGSAPLPREGVWALPQFAQPLLLSPLLLTPELAIPVVLDASGSGVQTLQHAGVAQPLRIVAQVVALGLSTELASTAPMTLELIH